MKEDYNRYLIDKLEELVLANKRDSVVLKEIDKVLAKRRDRLRNNNLRNDISRMLRNIDSAGKRPEGSRKLIKPSSRSSSINNIEKNKSDTKSTEVTNSSIPKPSKINYPEGFLAEAFEDMRKKLLDTSSGRSRLINLDQSRKGVVRIVDELPDELAKTFLSEKSMTVIPVPEPTRELLVENGYLIWDEEEEFFKQLKEDPDAKEWARVIGINNEYDLPIGSENVDDDRHTDLDLQSLMFEPALNLWLKKLASEARTSIDETGNNILFLSLGFLEWYDQAVEGRKRLAPLYMIPVKIEKHMVKNVAVYKLVYTGEDIIPNLTLREKLSIDFGMTLPDVFVPKDEERLLLPEEYFQEVNALIARKSNDPIIKKWKVRRFGTLATLSLGKLLMYLDLDPNRWPKGEDNLLEHEVIQRFFKDTDVGVGNDHSGESYVLDEVPELHQKYPMIEDADSSQMSVLIDVLKGEHMVVEGPPGTGKSQTITNLIAAAIAQGKNVLFVAEKQAALDVVKRRMDKTGLGEFCLDLHSNKAQKRLVLDSIQERIAKQPQLRHSISDYDVQVARYERAREQLQDYANMVNKRWKSTDLTIHDILSAATRYAQEVEPLKFKDIAPDSISGGSFSRVLLDEQLEQLEIFFNYKEIVRQQLGEGGEWASHPWFGLKNKALVSSEPEQLVELIEDWNEAIENLLKPVTQRCEKVGICSDSYKSMPVLESLIDLWSNIPELVGKEQIEAFRSISEDDIKTIETAIDLYKEVRSTYREARNYFVPELVDDLSIVSKLNNALDELYAMGVFAQTCFDDLARAVSLFEETIAKSNDVLGHRALLIPHLKNDVDKFFPATQNGFHELFKFVQLASILEPKFVNSRDELFDNDDLTELLGEIKIEIIKINSEREKYSKVINFKRLPSSKELHEYAKVLTDSSLISWLSPSWRKVRKKVRRLTITRTIDNESLIAALEGAANWLDACSSFNNSKRYAELLGIHFKGLDTDWTLIKSLKNWYKQVRKEYGIGFWHKVPLAIALFSMSTDEFKGLQDLAKRGFIDQIEEIANNLDRLSKIFPKEKCLIDKNETFDGDFNPLTLLQNDLVERLQSCQGYLVHPNMTLAELSDAILDLSKQNDRLTKLSDIDISSRYFDSQLDLTVNGSGEAIADLGVVIETVNYLNLLYSNSFDENLLKALFSCHTKGEISELIDDGKRFSELKDEMLKKEQSFMDCSGSRREDWFASSGLFFDAIQNRNCLAMNNIDWLDGWIKYLFAKERMEKGGFGRLKQYLLNSENSLDHAKKVMKFATYQSLAQEVYKEQNGLAERSGHEQSALQQQFAKYDEKLKELQRKRVAALAGARQVPAGSSGARVTSYSENYLLIHEIKKKARHISIRNLVTRAGRAMQAYKPCFMMSPMAVAKYIPPGSTKFDLVIMDEASQVKPEYALSCFARGTQVVVVGDPKQLPPTTFFERSVSNDDVWDENEGSIIDEAESILDAVGGQFTNRQLRWHYRSRHESLIEFSNHKFYESNLVVFPSPWSASEEYGIKFNYVESGRFLKGVNIPESRAVVDAIRRHLINSSEESLGVVAMNSKQRERIESDLELAVATDSILKVAYERNLQTSDPLFIKNLENVQGDERDVILISFTYGPQEKGSKQVPQRFGPINGPSGWRRLNVLFTRSKKRIQVYSSMTANQIILTDASSLGLKSLKGYLEYAQTGRLVGQTSVQEGEPDSDFEVAVMETLSRHGFECVPQVGVAGFFIDIAVRDPGMPGRYLMGIECDGATYHSSKSTRDRDRVRQSVLEGLDWRIRRIWSTDWFKNPAAELKPIIEELKSLATPISEVVDSEHEYLEPDEIRVKPFQEPKVDNYLAGLPQTLEERLLEFAVNVIEKECPETPHEQRLLRPEMFERLVEDMPTNREEFTMFIPGYLRTHTSVNEAKLYLDDVLEIIAEFESAL